VNQEFASLIRHHARHTRLVNMSAIAETNLKFENKLTITSRR